MKFEVINGNILLCKADTQKELTLTFFRFQESYESQNKRLKGKSFSTFEFLDAMMGKDGNIDYFSGWDGFNFPDSHYESFLNFISDDDITPYEQKLIDAVDKMHEEGTVDNFYVIGILKNDKSVLAHELSHALYYLNEDYRFCAKHESLAFAMFDRPYFDKIMKVLYKELKYSKDVLYDELVAWMATSSKQELEETFEVDYYDIDMSVKNYRKLFKKFSKGCIRRELLL